MKRYRISRLSTIFISMIYTGILLAIMKGMKPFQDLNPATYIVVFLIVGSSFFFWGQEKLRKQYEEEKVEKDERYIMIRNLFSHYFFFTIAWLIPPVLAILSIYDMQQISLKSIAIVFSIGVVLYVVLIEVIKKKA